MHAQAGGGIDFDDAAALGLEGLEDGVADDVDAGDVEADGLRGGNGRRRQVGVYVIGDIGRRAAGRQVGVVAQDDARPARRHRIGGQALLREALQGDLVEADLGQRSSVAVRAARVAVDDVDQLADRMLAVTDHQRWVAPCGGDQLVADDEHAPVMAGQEFLDHNVVTELDGHPIGLAHLRLARQIDRNALALVAILWLDDDREADFLGGSPSVVLVVDRSAERNGDTGGVQQLLGQFLVLRDRLGDRAGQAGFGGLDALLLAAPAELDEAALRQAAVRDAAGYGCRDDGAGRRAEADIFVKVAQFLERAIEVEGGVVQGRDAELLGPLEGQSADIFFRVFDDHLVGAGVDRLRTAAEGDRTAGLGLQAQGTELEGVGHRDLVEVVGGDQVAKLGKAVAQAVLEAGNVADGDFGTVAGDDGLDGGVAAPQVGAAQGSDTGNVHDVGSWGVSGQLPAAWPSAAWWRAVKAR